MISLTFDIDWATDEVIQHCLDILGETGAKGTFFATHDSAVTRTIETCGHEIGLHPNFLPNFNGEGRPYRQVIDELVDIFPTARGVRFHSLGMSAPVLDYCYQKGIVYDASVYLPFQAAPYREYTGIRRIPFIQSDLQMVIDQVPFEHKAKDYDPTLPYVYIFHPVHVFLNTLTTDHYDRAKKFYKDTDNLKKVRNNERPGVENLLRHLLQSFNSNEFVTLGEIYDRF